MNTQEKLGNALFNGLTKLREQKDTFNMEDLGALFQQISSNLHPIDDGTYYSFKEEIEKLAQFIEQTKKDISVIAVSDESGNSTDTATLHLDAVIKATEDASTTIMDAADAIQAEANKIGGQCQQEINESVTKIYEACNFQDITGQRLSKVIKILDEIDLRIKTLLKLFGNQVHLVSNKPAKTGANNDKDLLNGPQLPDHAPSQADIDALFASYKP